MYTMSRSRGGRPFTYGGCQVPVGRGICGETRTLDIINEFKMLYEEKIKEIDNAGGGDCLQEKIKLQQDWISDLTEQNEMLVRAVEELEHEATERVNMLEEKLQQSAQCICEVMNKYRKYDVTSDLLREPQEKILSLENDVRNLVEFIRRKREHNEWDMGGLKFSGISHRDLFGEDCETDFFGEESANSRSYTHNTTEEEKKVKDRDCKIHELQMKIDDVSIITRELQCKKEECDTLQKEMVDIRQALTEEVASKHDTILKLKRDCQELEERCIQADKQTAFRDDIIKELRKEIKQLKQQVTQDEIGNLTRTIDELQDTLQRTKQLQEDEEKKNITKISILNNTIEEVTNKLNEAQEKSKLCKICRGRSKVGFIDNTEVQTDFIDTEASEQNLPLELLEERDTIIKSQNDTLNMMQQELHNLKQTELELICEREEYCQNIQCLKNQIHELQLNTNNNTKDDVEKMIELVQNRDEIIRNQNETLNLMQQELASLKEVETNMRIEREKYSQNIQYLKNRINELEATLQNSDGRAENLQMAVDLYMNSINVLEASQAKYEIEIDQQRTTISNLQKALVDTKQELDTIKQKCEDNVSSSYWTTGWFGFSESKPTNNDQISVHDI